MYSSRARLTLAGSIALRHSFTRFCRVSIRRRLLACVLNRPCEPGGVGYASLKDDVRPTPEERLKDAGVKVTIAGMAEALGDQQQDKEVRYLSAVDTASA